MAETDLSTQTNLVRIWHLSQSYQHCVKFNLSDTLTDHTAFTSIKMCLLSHSRSSSLPFFLSFFLSLSVSYLSLLPSAQYSLSKIFFGAHTHILH
jgi:hypothetical protein